MQGPSFSIPDFIPLGGFVALVFALIFIWWLIYTLVVVYHWYRYARDSWLFVPIIIFHLMISGWLVLFITT